MVERINWVHVCERAGREKFQKRLKKKINYKKYCTYIYLNPKLIISIINICYNELNKSEKLSIFVFSKGHAWISNNQLTRVTEWVR